MEYLEKLCEAGSELPRELREPVYSSLNMISDAIFDKYKGHNVWSVKRMIYCTIEYVNKLQIQGFNVDIEQAYLDDLIGFYQQRFESKEEKK